MYLDVCPDCTSIVPRRIKRKEMEDEGWVAGREIDVRCGFKVEASGGVIVS